MDLFRYDFGYNFFVSWGHLVPLVVASGFLALAMWRRWPRWLGGVAALVAVWALAGVFVTQFLFRINLPVALPTERFLESGAGHVLDAGAGSGRAAIAVLLARPGARVTALDIYEGNFGIDDNTPERLLANARLAGVADRVTAETGDIRAMPFEAGTFDAVISSYAIDHLPSDDIPRGIAEVARVLTPEGEFLLLIVNVDWLARLVSPHALAHHRGADAARWRTRLEQGGFEVLEQGTPPSTLYFVARKRP